MQFLDKPRVQPKKDHLGSLASHSMDRLAYRPTARMHLRLKARVYFTCPEKYQSSYYLIYKYKVCKNSFHQIGDHSCHFGLFLMLYYVRVFFVLARVFCPTPRIATLTPTLLFAAIIKCDYPIPLAEIFITHMTLMITDVRHLLKTENSCYIVYVQQ